MKYLTFLILSFLPQQILSQPFADHWQFIGVAIEEPGYHVWGSSPIIGPDGKVHLYAARWPEETKVDPGWRSHSEIAHYVSDKPEGPFKFSEVALTGTGRDTWDKVAVHNPAIHKVGGKYVLLYISNDNANQPPHPKNQCIGMAVSKSLYGPWERVGGDGLILEPPKNPEYWNYNSSNGVVNPAFLQHPDGGFFLYFKTQSGKMGLAIAENLEGPYVQLPFPVTQNDQRIEDGYAFMLDGKFCLLTTDNHGIIKEGGGILWKSDDGIRFTGSEPGYHLISDYVGPEILTNKKRHYGGDVVKLERPQVLLIDGKPAYLYAPGGWNIYGGDATVCYVLRFRM
jgi:hypothetical protein